MTQRFAGSLQEHLLALCTPQGAGTDHTHAIGMHVGDPLPEALEAGQRARRRFLVEAPFVIETGAQLHHLAQAVDDHQLAIAVLRDDHVKTVGTQIDRGQHIGNARRTSGQANLRR